jgi:mannose-6-phosphate isomerase-like protein (cupin superfamily)
MQKVSLPSASKRIRPGLVSYILLQHGDTPTNNMAVTWVEIEPGQKQNLHSHAPEQAYIIVSGRGRMQLDADFSEVQAGELVFIPSNVKHGIENTGSEKLIYVSASVPAFDLEALYDSGQLKQE